MQLLDKEFQRIVRETKTTRRYAGKLVGVMRRDAKPVWVLAHVEVQGDPESDFAERMFTYYSKIRGAYPVPVASLAVLADAEPSFQPEHYRGSLWNCRVKFQFPTVKLFDCAEPEELPQWPKRILAAETPETIFH